jgi:hypothetical protein
MKAARPDPRSPGTRVVWPQYTDLYPHDRHTTPGQPVEGVVLALTDPYFWANSCAFPEDDPDPQRVAAHVAEFQAAGQLLDVVPVQWDTGRVALAPVSDLVPVVDGQPVRPLRPSRPSGPPRPKRPSRSRPARPRPVTDRPVTDLPATPLGEFVPVPMPEGPPDLTRRPRRR